MNKHPIVAVTEWARLAQTYALNAGRRSVTISDDLAPDPAFAEAESVTLVAPPRFFSHDLVRGWLIAVPYTIVGVLTATSPAGVKFLMAKQLRRPLTSRVDPGFVTIDAIQQRLSRANGPQELTAASLKTAMGRSWSGAVIHCHGEGSHLNLGCGVICGCQSDRESVENIIIDAGCSLEHRRCRRANEQRPVLGSLGDVRATDIALLTCNGFTVASDLFPSDNSLVLSAVAGFPARVMCSPDLVSISPKSVHTVESLLRSSGLSAAVREANQSIGWDRFGRSCWLMIGDPAQVSRDRRRTSSRRTVPPAESVRPDAELAERLLNEVPTMLAVVEAASRLTPSEETSRALLDLASDTRLLERGLRARILSRRSSVKNGDHRASVNLMYGEWLKVAMAFSKRFVQNRPEEALLRISAECNRWEAGNCVRCGASTWHSRRAVPNGPYLRTRICPTCGLLYVGPEPEPKLTLDNRRHDEPEIRVLCESDVPESPQAVVYGFTNKASGRAIALGGGPRTLWPLQVDLKTPLEPDLHTLRVITCRGLMLGVTRFRVAYFVEDGPRSR